MTKNSPKNAKNYWLMKSEAGCYSIDDLHKEKKTLWTGIRNYQARNLLRDSVKAGDLAFFYHSSSDPTGVAGVMRISEGATADPTQFDARDEHYDPKATKERPIWSAVGVEFVEKFSQPVTLQEIKFCPELRGIPVAAQGNRLSVQPVSKEHFEIIMKMARQ